MKEGGGAAVFGKKKAKLADEMLRRESQRRAASSWRIEVVPGWYADPAQRYDLRYWDGVQWTGRAATRGVEADDPVPRSISLPAPKVGSAPVTGPGE